MAVLKVHSFLGMILYWGNTPKAGAHYKIMIASNRNICLEFVALHIEIKNIFKCLKTLISYFYAVYLQEAQLTVTSN